MFRIILSENFMRKFKRLSRKYHSLDDDFEQLLEILEQEPTLGEKMRDNCYKIRLRISSKNKGKSAGGRVITCVKVIDEIVHVLTIYDKSEKENLEKGELDELLKQIDL